MQAMQFFSHLLSQMPGSAPKEEGNEGWCLATATLCHIGKSDSGLVIETSWASHVGLHRLTAHGSIYAAMGSVARNGNEVVHEEHALEV